MSDRKIIKNKEKQEKPETYIHLIVFKLGGEEYGVRIEHIKEVTRTPPIYKMPKTPAFIKGVANIRGDIIAVMDLEERFGVKRSSALSNKPEGYTLVSESEDFSIGFIVQKVPETFSMPVSMISQTPEFMKYSKINSDFIEGIGKVDKRLIIILNLNKVLSVDEAAQLTEIEKS